MLSFDIQIIFDRAGFVAQTWQPYPVFLGRIPLEFSGFNMPPIEGNNLPQGPLLFRLKPIPIPIITIKTIINSLRVSVFWGGVSQQGASGRTDLFMFLQIFADIIKLQLAISLFLEHLNIKLIMFNINYRAALEMYLNYGYYTQSFLFKHCFCFYFSVSLCSILLFFWPYLSFLYQSGCVCGFWVFSLFKCQRDLQCPGQFTSQHSLRSDCERLFSHISAV